MSLEQLLQQLANAAIGKTVEEIREAVLKIIEDAGGQALFEIRRAFENQWQEALVTWVSYNVAAYPNERLARLAAIVQAEVTRRAAA